MSLASQAVPWLDPGKQTASGMAEALDCAVLSVQTAKVWTETGKEMLLIALFPFEYLGVAL